MKENLSMEKMDNGTIFNKKELIVGLILKFIVMGFGTFGLIAQAFNNEHSVGALNYTFFTVISNIVVVIMTYIFFIFDLYFLTTKKDLRNQVWYLLKFTATIGIAITFLIYSTLLLPPDASRNGFIGALFKSSHNICVHVIVPIFSIIDFFYSDYNFKTKKVYFIYPVIYLLSYFIFLLILSLGFKVTWPNGGASYGTTTMPYVFIDYEINGWFTFDLSKLNLKNGVTGVGVFYVFIFMFIIVVLISLLFLYLEKCIQNKKYKSKTIKQ